MSRGLSNFPAPGEAIPPTNAPSAALNIWMRSLFLSATAIHLPSVEYAAECGRLNCPAPVPLAPNSKAKAPLAALNTWMRSLPESATATLVPSGE